MVVAAPEPQPPKKSTLRERVLEAALGLLSQGGVKALTTVSIAKAAGIHQPNFYAAFKNVDDCLEALAEHVVSEFQRLDNEDFEAVREAVRCGRPHMEASVRYHQGLVDRLMDNRQITELFLRHRHETSAFGRAMRHLEQEMLDSTTANLWDWAIRAGLGGKHLAEVRLLAEFHVGAVATAIMALIEERTVDRKAVGTALAYNADATITATFRRLLLEERPPR